MNTPTRTVLAALAAALTALFPAAPSRADAPAAPVALFPAPGGADVCPDAVLRLTFPARAALGSGGLVRVVDIATGAQAAAVDLATPVSVRTIGGLPGFNCRPVQIVGNEAEIHLDRGALGRGRTYAVTVDAGAFTSAGTPSAAVGLSPAWRFSTRAAAPAAGAGRITVSADGTGDFCTVQGAVDSIPAGSTAPVTVFIRKGLYRELVHIEGRSNVTFLGEDRRRTVIAYTDNNRFNPKPGPYRRGVFSAGNAPGLVIANLTIRNTTPYHGTQAEAVIVDGSVHARTVLAGLDLYSYQDTLQVNGQAWITGCRIDGDVDFLWGNGPSFFEGCTFNSVHSGSYYTQVRNPPGRHGFVFSRCVFDGAPGVAGAYLSRIEPGRFPASEVVLLNCTLGASVGPKGWLLQRTEDPHQVHFWEFGNRDFSGRPADATFRAPYSRQLSGAGDAAAVAAYSDPASVLGDGWKPALSPEVSGALRAAGEAGEGPAPVRNPDPGQGGQPADQIVLEGTTALLTVPSGGSGPVHYRWSRDGRALDAPDRPCLRIPSASTDDSGAYSVRVSGPDGATDSRAAVLTVVTSQAVPAPRAQAPRIPESFPPVLSWTPEAPPRLPSILDAFFRVTDFGARGDGVSDNTGAFAKSIACALAAGGGVVEVPAASKAYLCGPLALGSGIDFQVDAGAVVEMLPYGGADAPPPGTYPLAKDAKGRACHPDFISASHAHDLVLSGGGIIEGQGGPWWAAYGAHQGDSKPHRPFMVRLGGCDRVLVTGLTFRNSPMFHLALGASNLTVFGVTVQAPVQSPNTDGIDPDGVHQLIQNCCVSDGDDNIAVKAGNDFCGDILVADCAFGAGHGLSVGGQTTRGLDGMTVRNCSFDGGTTGLRLKASPAQGGSLKNVRYANLAMTRVAYPIIFYSYYGKVGNPGATGGGRQAIPELVRKWNAEPPFELGGDGHRLSWSGITITGLTASLTTGRSIIWGLPTAGGLFDSVTLRDVRIDGGAGLGIYDAANVLLTGGTGVGELLTCNALVLTEQPAPAAVAAGGTAVFRVKAEGGSGTGGARPRFSWRFDGRPLADGPRADGAVVSGAATPELTITRAGTGEAGQYAALVACSLDGYDPVSKGLRAASIPVQAQSESAGLAVDGAP